MPKLVLLLSVFFSFSAYSQSAKKENAPITIRGVIGIARATSSQQFRQSFAGLYEANISLNFKVKKQFFIGAGYQSTFFKNNEAIQYKYYNASIPYNTQLVGNSGFIKLGYDQFLEKVYMSYALNVGYSFFQYKNVNQDSSLANQPFVGTSFSAPYLQPEIAVNFLTDRTLSFSIILSYTTLFYFYDPKAPRFNQFEEINDLSNNAIMSWINIGFGFNILINKK
jgi:hypothetical protein